MANATALPHVTAPALAAMIPPATTALVIVDVQVDFAAPHGLLGRVGADLSAIPAALARIEALVAAARAARVTVAFLRVVTRPETDMAALRTLMARRGMPGGEAICRAEGGGADHYRVAPGPDEIAVDKLLYDGFHGTDLDARLRARRVETVVMTGFSTDCCVDQTARSAFHRDYNVFVVSDATAAYEDGLHVHSLDVLRKNVALLVAADEVVDAWR